VATYQDVFEVKAITSQRSGGHAPERCAADPAVMPADGADDHLRGMSRAYRECGFAGPECSRAWGLDACRAGAVR
jgi:hypothetical protein